MEINKGNTVRKTLSIIAHILFIVSLLLAYAATHFFFFGSPPRVALLYFTIYCSIPLILLFFINRRSFKRASWITAILIVITIIDYYDLPPRTSHQKHFINRIGDYDVDHLFYRAFAWLDYDGSFRFHADPQVQRQIINDLALNPKELTDYTISSKMDAHYYWWRPESMKTTEYYTSEVENKSIRLLVCKESDLCYLKLFEQ